MMKRNDGYALPFVLVVMVVVCLIAVSVMSFSLRCLQSQQASIERMENKYAAMGGIETIVSQILNKQPISKESTIIYNADTEKTVFISCSYTMEEKYLDVIAKCENVEVGYRIILNDKLELFEINHYKTDGVMIEGYAPLDQGGAS